ncbi:aldo/keto reductase, partial [Streptomyces sp. ND04-05B]|nr:aldo/keto reductase [Streptomyces sp. ND04-05B]
MGMETNTHPGQDTHTDPNAHTAPHPHPDPYTRSLGRSGIRVSALGFGCWAIGGEWQAVDGQPLGWGRVDDEESVR